MNAPAAQQQGAQVPKPRSIRARAVLLALLFAFPVVYATANQGTSHIFSLMTAPVALLIILVLANVPLRRLAPKAALSQADLIVIFSLSAVASSVAGEWTSVMHGSVHMFGFQAETSDYAKKYFVKYLPDWLIVKDKNLVLDLDGGGKGLLYVLGRVPFYFKYYVAWGGLMIATLLAMLSINSLMRKAWCETERLSFPLIQLPVALADEKGALLRSKPMWIAFAVMFGIDMLNGFSYLFPNIPSVPTKTIIDLGALFKDPPYNSIGLTPIAIYPFMAALGFFIPSDLVFSFVLFYLLRKVTHVILASQGFPQGVFSGTYIAPGPPYFDEQSWGGVLALFVGAVWFGRSSLKEIWRDIVSGRKPEDGGVPHRWAFVLLIVCMAVVIGYGLAGELPLWYSTVYTVLFLIFCVVLTRMRAQIGCPTHEFAFFGPNSFMNRFFGTRWLTDGQAAWVSQVFLFMNRLHRNHPMPYQLEAVKMAQLNRLNQRQVFLGIAAFSILAYFLARFSYHAANYRLGDHGYWNEGETYLRNIVDKRSGPDMVGITMTMAGFAMVMVMDAVRFRFPGFPLHPAGYVLSLNFGVDYYWFGVLVAMLIKNFVQKYYGLRGYDKLRQVGLGILMGEYLSEIIWVTFSILTRQSTYTMSFNDRSLGLQ